MSKTKNFNAVAMMRSIRERVSSDIEGMTLEQELQWLAFQEIMDPYLRQLQERAAQSSTAMGVGGAEG
jgi:hypothetical protein